MSVIAQVSILAAGAAAVLSSTSSLMHSKTNAQQRKQSNGFMTASTPKGGIPRKDDRNLEGGIQAIHALCEVTGGGQKVYGIAIEYDRNIDASSLVPDTYVTMVYPALRRGPPGMHHSTSEETSPPKARSTQYIYTNTIPALRDDSTSVRGQFVITEFKADSDPSSPSEDTDKVAISQQRDIETISGDTLAASDKVWTNSSRHGNNAAIRGVDEWEQNHWWWDDARSAWLEYSIFLPKSFLADGGDHKHYPLLLAITHSGTNIDGTCAETLTEQCIASIWSLPEEQAAHECVVITPRYERTTMNDYWEHTSDVENIHKLVESLMKNTWNYGNPNLPDRCDKTLKIDRSKVYCTGWSMGAMTSLWLMSKHPQTYTAGLIIAGQQRPSDLVDLATQKVLIITGEKDHKSTLWNEKCVPVWREAGSIVVRPSELFDASLIFPLDEQDELSSQLNQYLDENANITFFTFANVDHMEAARKFFYIKAAKNWLFRQIRP